MADASLTPVEALTPAIILLGVCGASVIAAKFLRISSIVGYLAAGILIGPHVLGLIEESGTTHLLAELGVVFLLFDIGMHISAREIRESRSDLIGLAPAHMLLSAVPFTLILGLFGLSWPAAIAVGVSLALSSTAVVSRIIDDRGLNTCPLGKSAIHVLIFQDIVAIFLLIFASSLGTEGTSLAWAMTRAASLAILAFAAALLAGRYLMGPFLRLIASTRSQEAFTAATLFLVLAAAAATYALGLSLTLGAFLAGLAVSGTAYRHQIQTETGPFRGLLLSFFFMSVGLMLDVPAMMANLPLIIGIAFGIMIVKTLLGAGAGLLNGWSLPGTTQLGFLLAQGSEFTLVVLSLLVAGTSLIAPFYETVIVAAVALSLAIAPVWADVGMRLSRWIAAQKRNRSEAPATDSETAQGPVVVFGLTEAGRLAVDALRHNNIAHIALDNDPDRFIAATADGYDVHFGNAANMNLFSAIAGRNACAVVVGAPNYVVAANLTPMVAREYPNTLRFVSLPDQETREKFSELGFRAWLSKTSPAGVEMVADLLRQLEVEETKVSDWLKTISDIYHMPDRSDEIVHLVEAENPQAEAA